MFFSILTLLASNGRCEALSYMLTKNPAKAHVGTSEYFHTCLFTV